MNHNKKAGIHLFLLSFPKCQREKKILIEHSLWLQALKKGEKQRVLGLLYHNVYQIQKTNFPQNLYLNKVYLSHFQLSKKLKRCY